MTGKQTLKKERENMDILNMHFETQLWALLQEVGRQPAWDNPSWFLELFLAFS